MYSPQQWNTIAAENRLAAEEMNAAGRYRACVTRCYYSAYQTATSICVAHGDGVNFPQGWNNPSHEQLPGLVLNNSAIAKNERRLVARLLRSLRYAREDADYRPGRTVDKTTALNSLRDMLTVRRLLKAKNDG